MIPAAFRVHNLHHWFHLALVVLVSACPCALILSTPVASFCALTKAATSGLLVKGGDYLEILSKIKITAFDKTGTLTRGEFVVTNFRSLCEDISLNTLLYWYGLHTFPVTFLLIMLYFDKVVNLSKQKIGSTQQLI